MTTKTLFPFSILQLTFNQFDDIVYYFYYYVWTYQILLALVYCLITKRFLPPKNFKKHDKNHFLLRQLNFYFIAVIIIYIAEIYYENLHRFWFERFAHHVFAILCFASTVYEPNVISFWYLSPTFIHAIYWSFLRNGLSYIDQILMLYNFNIFISAGLYFRLCCHSKMKRITIRTPLFITFVFNANMMGYFYGNKINFDKFDNQKFILSVLKSCDLAAPVYIYLTCLIYKDYRKKRTNNQNEFSTII